MPKKTDFIMNPFLNKPYQMKKIAQVAHHYLPHLGGIELYVSRLFEDIKDQHSEEFAPRVLTTDYQTPLNGRKAEATYFPVDVSLMRNPFSIAFLRHLFKTRYDLLHLHNAWFLTSLVSVILKKTAKIVLTMHGVFPDNASCFLRLALFFYRPLAALVIKRSDKIIVLSDSEKLKLEKLFFVDPQKIAVIPNGIRIATEAIKIADTAKAKTILFTGRIIPDKNPELLIKSAARIKELISDYKIKFVGPVQPEYRESLMCMAKRLKIDDLIEFTGALDQSIPSQNLQLINQYMKSQIFVSLGSWEGLPTRLLEAMQFGASCIAYTAGGSSDLIQDGHNGLLLYRLNEAELAEKIANLVTNHNLRDKIAHNAKQSIIENHDWENVSKKILEIYQQLLR